MTKSILHIIASLAVIAFAVAPATAQTTLQANPTTNNNGATGWGIFFDLSAATPLTITGMTTASNAVAGATFSIEIFTRIGTGLGGPVGSGAGSSSAGWTSLGSITVTQGASGISLPINLPNFSITGGQTIGVALVFTGAGPSYFGTGAPPIQQFTDGTLTLATGDARSAPFTTAGSFFSSRGLTGSITYTAVPEPSSLALIGFAGLGLAAGLRRRARSQKLKA